MFFCYTNAVFSFLNVHLFMIFFFVVFLKKNEEKKVSTFFFGFYFIFYFSFEIYKFATKNKADDKFSKKTVNGNDELI